MPDSTWKPIVINEFRVGIGESPDVGFGRIFNMDTYSNLGTFAQNYATAKRSSTTVTDLIKWFTIDPTTTNIYALGNTGKVYKSTDDGTTWSLVSGNTTTNGDGDGLAVWKDYLFVARNTNLDVMKISDETWTNGWQTLTSTGTASQTAFHPMLWAQDDLLYIGNSRYVASLEELTTFVPGTAASYNWNAQALDLPSAYKIKCLEELGQFLMIGTWQGVNSYDVRIADIFPWDRISDSFEIPIRLTEFGVSQMLTINNLLHITAGLESSVYVSNSSTTQFTKQLPRFITGLTNGAYAFNYPGAIIKQHNRAHFGFSSGTSGSGYGGFGVWSVNNKGGISFENQISTGTTTATTAIQIGALFPVNADTYLIGWQDNATFGIDQIDQSNRYTSYTAFLETPLLRVGTIVTPRTFSTIEITLQDPLTSGQGIRWSWRNSAIGAYSSPVTYDFATNGAILGFSSPAGIANVINVQLKIELTGTSPVYVREIKLI